MSEALTPHSELAERVGDALNTLFGNTDVVYSGSHEAHEDGHAALVSLVEQLEAAKEDRDRCGRMLLDVEGSLLAYWTDIPETEIERLRVTIRHVLDTLPSLEADLVAANSNPASRSDDE